MRGKIPETPAVFFCGAFLVALAFSAVFIVLHADHDCSPGEYCPACVQLRAAVNLLKQCGPAPGRLSGGFGFFAAAEFFYVSSPYVTQPTIVSLKIRMNT
jgi:hypothetical protein